jgi:hypothetical protein
VRSALREPITAMTGRDEAVDDMVYGGPAEDLI